MESIIKGYIISFKTPDWFDQTTTKTKYINHSELQEKHKTGRD